MIEQNVYEISAERVAERLIEAFAAAALGIPPMKLLRRKDKALALIVANLATAGATI